MLLSSSDGGYRETIAMTFSEHSAGLLGDFGLAVEELRRCATMNKQTCPDQQLESHFDTHTHTLSLSLLFSFGTLHLPSLGSDSCFCRPSGSYLCGVKVHARLQLVAPPSSPSEVQAPGPIQGARLLA